MQDNLSEGKDILNDYHRKRNKIELKGVGQMLKKSYSLEQMQKQALEVKRIMNNDQINKL
jgi:hypothetical protein